ncbi:hypothetical protein ZWY2020_028292 [Hordeum vulgare]|nr:hypothetical protein ZWY2020_028292 [Hordeum vulgare]
MQLRSIHPSHGCPGAYSEAAAKKVYPSCETVPCEYFETAFQLVSPLGSKFQQQPVLKTNDAVSSDSSNTSESAVLGGKSNLPGAAEHVDFVAESANPMFVPNVAKPLTETIGGHSLGARVAPVGITVHDTTDTHVRTLDGTCIVGDTEGTVGNELPGLEGENDDEGWSQPKELYLGMRFDTLEGAKEH